MAAAPLHRQFAGQAQLVRLLLWRVGDSTDVDACLRTARSKNMIAEDDEAFLRGCLEAEEQQRESAASDLAVNADTIARLRRCADKLNRADSA